jgi:serine/threonine-protein kinase PknG
MSTDGQRGAGTPCVRPDCRGRVAGTIDLEGYCDACGREPAAVRSRTPVTRRASVTAAAGGRCSRTGCPGFMDEDGYCDSCNRAAPEANGPAVHAGFTPIWRSAVAKKLDRAEQAESAPLRSPDGLSPPPLSQAPIGLGIVAIAAVDSRDPESLLRDDDELMIEEAKRRCPKRDSRPQTRCGLDGTRGATEAMCPECGFSYSFRPPLRRDEWLNQYQVRGCIGYGGQGWVYLAHDVNLDGDPVAIKAQRDDQTAESQEAALKERRMLIQLRHPGIVDIRNFVKHGDSETGYIVLELLAGMSLEQKIMTARLGPAEAISYILAVLPALGYLHDSKLVYSDFKPANIMQVGDRIKLIDLGAVRQMDASADLPPVVTAGFRAPEVRQARQPSASSDLYTVGRTLAVLTAPVEYTEEWKNDKLPGPEKIEVFGKYESFYRFLCRATAANPRRRFVSAAEMADQLVGVLREVVALDGAGSRYQGNSLPPRPSALFTPERDVVTFTPERTAVPVEQSLAGQFAQALPVPRHDDTDPGAAFLSTITATDPAKVMHELRKAPSNSAEVVFRRTLARIPLLQFAEANEQITPVTTSRADRVDWRFVWYRGLVSLAAGEAEDAWHAFAAIRDLLPGEPAPKLALAMCAEHIGQLALARHYYQTVWRTGHEFVGAAFGVARCYAGVPGSAGIEEAISTLESVPKTLRYHDAARIKALQLRLERPELDEKGLHEAARKLTELKLDDEPATWLRIQIWQAALAWLEAGGVPDSGDPLLDVSFTPAGIGFGMAAAYLKLRRYVPRGRERTNLVKRAHAARPRTRWRRSTTARDKGDKT